MHIKSKSTKMHPSFSSTLKTLRELGDSKKWVISRDRSHGFHLLHKESEYKIFPEAAYCIYDEDWEVIISLKNILLVFIANSLATITHKKLVSNILRDLY